VRRDFRAASAVAIVAGAAFSTAAVAYQVTIDSFTVVKNWAPLLIDNFDAGGPPPQGPNFLNNRMNPSSYSMIGTMGPENAGASGKLVLDQSGAVITSDLVGGGHSLTQAARLNIDTDSSNTINGLKRNHTFSVIGLFDLSAPGHNERYGIRLTDRGFAANANDVIDLRVIELAGVPVVQFRETDAPAGTRVNLYLPLELRHEQIALTLDPSS
jgi:hypothetical protein